MNDRNADKEYTQAVANKAENPLYGLMRAYVQAKEEFDALCYQEQQTTNARATAEKTLHELSEKVAGVVREGVNNPAIPQPTAVCHEKGYDNGPAGQMKQQRKF